MATGLGVVVGSVNSVAAVDAGRGGFDNSPQVVVTHSSTLALSADAAPVLGSVGRVPAAVVVGGFVERVGDPIGILADDGSIYRGEDLTATAIGCLVDEATRTVRTEPTIVTTYPASWPHYTVDALREALERAGFGDVTPVPEPMAAVRWLEATHGPLGDGAVVVYDLGGSKLDITVARTGRSAGLIGTPIHSEDISGAHFDHLTMQHVLAGAVDVDALDVFDPAVEDALAALRVRARRAKEALSTDTETAISVDLGGEHVDVRLVRDEIEDLLREPLTASIELVREAVRVAGLELGDVSQVLLIGGGSSIPLVAELISSNLGVPVVSSANPGHTAALGAATIATELGAAAAALAEPIAAAAVPHSVAAVVSAPRPAPAAPIVSTTDTGMSRWKKVAVVGSSVAAIMLTATGVLALGTGTFTDTKSESPASSSVAVTTTAGVPAASTAPEATATTATTAPGESAAASSAGATSRAESVPANNGDTGSGDSAPQAPAQSPQPQEPESVQTTDAPAPVQPTQNPAPVQTTQQPAPQTQGSMSPQPNPYTVPTLPNVVPDRLPIVGGL